MSGNPIDAIAERLDGGRLWIKGDLGSCYEPTEPVCLVGSQWALDGARNAFVMACASRLICYVIRERYPERIDLDCWVQRDFNDHPDTTWEDVALVLKDASARWDEAL